MDNSKPTKTDETKNAYLLRAKSITSHFQRKVGRTMEPDDPEFIPYFLARTKNKSQSNWRQLKASMIHYFEVTGQNKLASKLLNMEVNHEDTTSKSLFNLTSSKKKKSVSDAELKKIGKYLITTGGSSTPPAYDKALMCMFNGSIATGLRPVEWSTAEIIDVAPENIELAPPILKVKNAKSTNGRSYGEYRYLGLSDLSEINMNFVRLAIRFCSNPVNKYGESITFPEFYKNCRGRFYNVINHVFNKPKDNRITLYSARHQFIANLKIAGYPLEEIACLVGHGNDLTASKHYGKRRVGNKNASGFPKANKSDIAKVRARYQHFAQHNHNIKTKDSTN
ncbi:hypothetical protein EI165_10260 [Pseudoalteromonas nigrifaciens]|uniref:hypothetical protein n=1 Tax=Pseudoalteromonas nigrifaciens TaxID=28109 RepID=UPI001787970F|nr:hypothetical protein [Pseudoalteromonas nigrifaciens]MBE0420503.1 hypothetical protein [Pseudoalteromonas nigrifaciens]